jgi:lysophospholipase L1-like esterase
MTGIVTDLVAFGPKVLLFAPSMTNQASGLDYDNVCAARIQGYQTALKTILGNFATSNPGRVSYDDTWYQYVALHINQTTPNADYPLMDNIHPNALGAQIKGECIAAAIVANIAQAGGGLFTNTFSGGML